MTKFILCGMMLLAGAANPLTAEAQTISVVVTADTKTSPVAASPFGASAAIDNGDLSTVTGQSDLAQVVTAQNTSTVSGNTVSGNSQTGTIRFDGGSFQNLNGLSLLSANTGNNVSINSSLNVNVAINR
jgi:hypothetical protein